MLDTAGYLFINEELFKILNIKHMQTMTYFQLTKYLIWEFLLNFWIAARQTTNFDIWVSSKL